MTKAISLQEDLVKANFKLEEALSAEVTELNQDATIQRFEFTFEIAWKLMNTILKENGIEAYGIKTTIREATNFGLIEDPLQWFNFLESRNLSTHTYDSEEARKIYEDLKDFPPLVKNLLDKIKDF